MTPNYILAAACTTIDVLIPSEIEDQTAQNKEYKVRLFDSHGGEIRRMWLDSGIEEISDMSFSGALHIENELIPKIKERNKDRNFPITRIEVYKEVVQEVANMDLRTTKTAPKCYDTLVSYWKPSV